MNCVICRQNHTASEACRPLAGPAVASSAVPEGAAQAAVDPLIGTTIGSFRIVRLLGLGGMGVVYLGENTLIGSRVAVKFLHAHLAGNPDLVARFYAEARAVNFIGHENIVNIFDMAVAPGNRPYFIMEYLDGIALAELATGPVEPKVALPLLVQVCDALQAAHERGVVHRDLKPENIFLVKRGRRQHFVKVLDFGIAKLFGADAGPSRTSAGVVIGTPEYMAPEQCSTGKVDGRADLYALGIISYLLATGRLPFDGGGLTDILLAHRDQVPPAPSQVNAAVPAGWSNLTMRAMAKKPEDRFQQASEMAEAMEAVLASLGLDAPAGARRPATPAPSATTTGTVGPEWTVAPASTPGPSPQPVSAAPSAAALPEAEAVVLNADGTPKRRLKCVDLSRAGFYLRAETDFPPLCSRLKVALELPQGRFEVAAEVVRHVPPDQAQAWKMPAGFYLKLDEPSPALRDAISKFNSKAAPGQAAPAPVAPAANDAEAGRAVSKYQALAKAGPYEVLGVAPEAEMGDILARGRAAKRELDRLLEKALPEAQRSALEPARTQVAKALETIGNPAARAAFDAERGNFAGVARCISAGLTVTDAETLRRKYFAVHPDRLAKSQIQLATGNAYDTRSSFPQAFAAFEEAIRADPLNVELHKRYWDLKRRLASSPAEGVR